MELQTIGNVSRQLNISARTLRYYEQIGLIQSVKKDDSAYRLYDESALTRLKQIIILRKLRLPLKQIGDILQSGQVAVALEAFERNLNDIEDEITALTTIRSIIQSFMDKLNIAGARLQLLDDESLLEIVDSLTVAKVSLKEDKSMDDLNKADQKVNQLTDRNVRIVYLPPATVAASHYIGDEPEQHAGMALDQFVRDSNLPAIKPELRHYGFNHPNPGFIKESNQYGYEMWVTIPDDMPVPAPLIKKHFEGGLYAAHMIPMGAFEEWDWLLTWAFESKKYEPNMLSDNGEFMCGLLEENLNYRNTVWQVENGADDFVQLDLLLPIKERAQ